MKASSSFLTVSKILGISLNISTPSILLSFGNCKTILRLLGSIPGNYDVWTDVGFRHALKDDETH